MSLVNLENSTVQRSPNKPGFFEKNDDGSFSIRNSFNLYLTQSQMKNASYKLLRRNQNNPLQRFIYEKRSIRCPSCNNCLGLSKLFSTPQTFPCPTKPLDIKKLLN